MASLSPEIYLPPKLDGFFDAPARYRVLYGGRGSGKSWSIAQMLVVRAMQKKQLILCCRELQKSIRDSSIRIITDAIFRLGVGELFDVGESYIRHKINGSEFIFKGMRHNADEIKSTEGITIVWSEEAQKNTQSSLDVLIPTVRAEGSELWFSYNPDDEYDSIHQMFVMGDAPKNAIVLQMNYEDNPWFPDVLEAERVHFKKTRSEDDYSNVWCGQVRKAKEGTYYAKVLADLREKGMITKIPYNPAFPVMTYWDIGFSDYTSIWFVQQIGSQFNFIDYYQNCEQDPPFYARMLKEKKYTYKEHILPHDADHLRMGMGGKTIKQQFEDNVSDPVYTQKVSNNEMNDINAARQFMLRCAFDEKKCEQGLLSLRKFRKKWNEQKNKYDDKPFDDEYCHAADAFRYASVANIDSRDVAKAYEYDNLVDDMQYGVAQNDYTNDYI